MIKDKIYTRTENRSDFVETKDDEIYDQIMQLEKNGSLKKGSYLQQKDISDFAVKHYNVVVRLNNLIERATTIQRKEKLKYIKSYKQGLLLNLCSIIIRSVIKRFKTLYPAHYDQVYHECVLDILNNVNKNGYNPNLSAFSSYIYETCKWACIKYLSELKKENNNVQLLQ